MATVDSVKTKILSLIASCQSATGDDSADLTSQIAILAGLTASASDGSTPTLETVETKLRNLLAVCQAKTGDGSTDLTTQVMLLIDSFSTPKLYSYNGTVLPALPVWDKTAYPYAHIRGRKLFLSSSPITYDTGTWKYTCSTPYLLADFTYSADDISWSEPKETETQSTDGYNSVHWNNHNILDESGNVYHEASNPVPISLPFTLFDGEVTTTKSDYSEYSYGQTYELLYGYKNGDALRVTFNGESKEYTYATLKTNISDGGDFEIHSLQQWSTGKWHVELITKTAGTHNLKIELLKIGSLVGYSYNGAVLPALPDWDKETYPYAWIRPYAFGYLLSVQKEVSYAVIDGGYEVIEYPGDTKFYWVQNSSGEWIVHSPHDTMVTNGATWANFDILSTTGAVTLQASNPVPVYE